MDEIADDLTQNDSEPKKIKKKKVVIAILSLLLVIFLILISFTKILKNPSDVSLVETGKIEEEESVEGYIIRSEKVIKGNNYKNGIVQIKAEGEKVAKNSPVFRYYTKGEDELIEKIEDLDIKIQEAMSNQTDIFSSDMKVLETQIEEKIDDIYTMKDIQKINEYKKDINSDITKRAKIAGELSPAGSYIKQLIEERKNYENALNNGAEYINATDSGLVSYRVDGLEEILTPEKFSSLSVSMLENLNIKTGQIIGTSNEAGKIINNYECYIACIMDSERAKNSKVGDELELMIDDQIIDAKIQYVTDENDKRIIVFKIEKDVEELVNYRKISLDVIWWSKSGWKVPVSVLYTEETPIANNSDTKEENKKVYYVYRNRGGYLDKIYVKVLKDNGIYAIIDNYKDSELKELGYTSEQLKNRVTLKLYDEVEVKSE